MTVVHVSRVPQLRRFAHSACPFLPPQLRGRGVKMEALERRLLYAAGDVDASFGNGGLLIHNAGAAEFYNGATAVVEDAAGRLVATGHSETPATMPEDNGTLWVGRFLADGSVDTTFGDNGNVWIRGDCVGQHIALQSDGKIVVAGSLHELDGPLNDFGVWRFNADGSLDTTFGDNGMIRADFGGHEWPYGMAIDADDKIVVVGAYEELDLETYAKTVMQAMIVRYNADGSLDTTFGDGGVVRDDFGGHYDVAMDVHIQGDGKIVIGGTTGLRIDSPLGQSSSMEFAVARYNTDGTRDNTFGGGDGLATTDFGPAYGGGEGRSMHVDDQGRVTLVGHVSPENFQDGMAEGFVAFARFTADGQLDGTFGTGGVKRAAEIDHVWDMTADADGNLILSSTRPQGNNEWGPMLPGMRPDVEVSRFRPDGALDETFGDGGFARIALTDDDWSTPINGVLAAGLIVTRDGRIVAAGMLHGPGTGDAVLARFLGDDVTPEPEPQPDPETPAPDDVAPFDNPAHDDGDAPDPAARHALWSDHLLDPDGEDEEALFAGLI